MHDRIADWLLRLGVALAFLYPPLNALSNPYSWLGYFPGFMRGFVPDMLLLHGFGVVEIIIALWILSGKKIFWPSVAAALLLVLIVGFNITGFEVIFRDLSIAAAAVALAALHYPEKREEVQTVG